MQYNACAYHVEPDIAEMYVAQSSIPMSCKAFKAPPNPIIARNPPPDPKMAIVGV